MYSSRACLGIHSCSSTLISLGQLSPWPFLWRTSLSNGQRNKIGEVWKACFRTEGERTDLEPLCV